MGYSDGAIHTKYGAVHVHNEERVVPAAEFSAAGLVCITNRNGAAAVEGMNQNEAGGAAFAAVVNSDIVNAVAGNYRTVP